MLKKDSISCTDFSLSIHPLNIVVTLNSVLFFFLTLLGQLYLHKCFQLSSINRCFRRFYFCSWLWAHICNGWASPFKCSKDSFNASCSNQIHHLLQTCSSSSSPLTINVTSTYSVSPNPVVYGLLKCFFNHVFSKSLPWFRPPSSLALTVKARKLLLVSLDLNKAKQLSRCLSDSDRLNKWQVFFFFN